MAYLVKFPFPPRVICSEIGNISTHPYTHNISDVLRLKYAPRAPKENDHKFLKRTFYIILATYQ